MQGMQGTVENIHINNKNIIKFYFASEESQNSDRRQEAQPVVIERRISADRRSSLRVPEEELFAEFLSPMQAWHKIQEKQRKLKKVIKESKIICAACSPFIPVRRVSSVPCSIESNDYAKAAGMVAVAAILLPEDLRDMKDAYNQIVHKTPAKYDYAKYQTPFSFIRGTLIQPIVNKMGKWGYYLHQMDKSLADTKLGTKIADWLGVTIGDAIKLERKVPMIEKIGNEYVVLRPRLKAIPIIQGSAINKLIYRAMQRTTAIGTAVLFALWIPSIIKAFKKPDETKEKFVNAGKQTSKAVINNSFVLAGIGLLGALGGRKGPAYSVLGMGAGSVIGSLFAGFVNKNIETKN